jgi:hypothetical protein
MVPKFEKPWKSGLLYSEFGKSLKNQCSLSADATFLFHGNNLANKMPSIIQINMFSTSIFEKTPDKKKPNSYNFVGIMASA